MITTVTLNPAIDKTLYIDDFTVNSINRVKRIKETQSGKGINVSRLLQRFGIPCCCTGFMAGEKGRQIHESLCLLNIKSDFIWVEGEVRTNIKIADIKNNTFTDINETGFNVKEYEIEQLIEKVKELSWKSRIIIMSGSIPGNVPEDIYSTLIKHIRQEKDIPVILDTSGQFLRYGAEARPDILKPNIHELEELTGVKCFNKHDVIQVCRSLNKKGIKIVIVTMGEAGAVAVTDTSVYEVNAPKVQVMSTVGAGDCFLGGFCYGIYNGFDMENALKMAASCASAKVTMEGTEIPKKNELLKFITDIEVKEYNI